MVGEESEAVIHGWGCTPTGDPPPAAVSNQNNNSPKCIPEAIMKGWRRTTLYGILIFLMILVFLNIALTLWIISALKLSMNGVGPIKIVRGGIQLEGQAWVVDKLVSSMITSQVAQPITLHSHRNFTVLVSEPNSKHHSKLLIKRDNIECNGRVLDIRDSHGVGVLRASREEVRVFAEVLAVDGVGGVNVRSALQVPHVKAPPGSDLQLESLTRRLDLQAPQSIQFESRAGSIDVIAHNNIKLVSVVGALRIDSQNIILDNLKQANTTDAPQKNTRNKKVYQLCVCASGKLFLAPPDATCAIQDDKTEVCR